MYQFVCDEKWKINYNPLSTLDGMDFIHEILDNGFMHNPSPSERQVAHIIGLVYHISNSSTTNTVMSNTPSIVWLA